jgi:phage-related protein
MEVGRVEATLGVDSSEFDRGIDKAGESLDTFGGRFGDLSSTMSGALAMAGGQILTSLGGAVVSGATEAAGAVFSFSAQSQQAARDLSAALGLPIEETERLADVSKRVFANNFAGDVNEAATAVGIVRQQLGDLSDIELQAVTEDAFRLKDAFGVEVADSVSATKTLMQEFGLTSQQATDFLATGFQKGLDRSGDFLDTINEYGTQFSEGGATAAEFFSIIESGAGGGMLGTDKAADSFKEFRIRITEGSDDVVDALTTLGNSGPGEELAKSLGISGPLFIDTEEKAIAVQKALKDMGRDVSLEQLLLPLTDVDEKTGAITTRAQEFGDVYASQVLQGIEDGSISAMDAQNLVLNGMGKMENKVHQNTVGVALMGTQWEDMGAESVLAMSSTTTSLEDMTGAVDKVDAKYGSLSSTWEGVKRQAILAFSPIADKILEIANDFMPVLNDAFVFLGGAISGAVDLGIAAFDLIMPIVTGVADAVKLLFSGDFTGEGLFGLQEDDPAIGVLFTIRDTFTSVWADVEAIIAQITPMIQIYVIDVFNGVVEFLAANQESIIGIIEGAWGIISGIFDVVLGVITNVVIPTFAAIYDFIVAHYDQIKTTIQGAWDFIAAVVKTAIDLVKGIIDTVLALLKGDWEGAWNSIKDTLKAAWDNMGVVIDTAITHIKNVLSLAWEAIKALIGAALTFIGGLLSGWWETIKSGASVAWNYIKDDIILAAWSGIKTAVDTVITTIKDAISGAWTDIQDGAKVAWDAIKKVVTDTWDGIVSATNTVIETVKGIIDGAKTILETAFSGAVSGIAGIIDGALSAVINTFVGIINSVIEATNLLIDGINLVNPMDDIPHIPIIPRYAIGTLSARGGMALVGEQGPELVSLPAGSRVYSNRDTEAMQGDTYNLNVYTDRELESVEGDFSLMKALRPNV